MTYPRWILERAIRDIGVQLVRFRAGDGLAPELAKIVGYHLGDLFGAKVGDVFSQSRQAQGQLPIAGARRLHIIGLLFGLLSWLCTIIILGSRLATRQIALNALVFAGILWNAIITGALSGPHDRVVS